MPGRFSATYSSTSASTRASRLLRRQRLERLAAAAQGVFQHQWVAPAYIEGKLGSTFCRGAALMMYCEIAKQSLLRHRPDMAR